MSASAPTPADDSEALLRRLEWQVLKRLDGLLQGDWRTLLRGGGVDLAGLREYAFHDDVRHIDWNVTARLQQPYVRQFVEDRELSAWFLLDLSASVDFGSTGTTKLAVSSGFVAALARIITRHGNRVGAMLYGASVDTVLPPRATRLHVLELLQRMRSPRAAARSPLDAGHARAHAAAPPPSSTGTALADLLLAAEGLIKRRSLLFVVSDFISRPGWEPVLARLARRHDLVAVRLWDPLEMALPDLGWVTLADAETGEQVAVDASDPAFRARYAALADAREAALQAALAASGADILELATDDDLLATLLRLCELRRQRARRGAPLRFPRHLQRAEVRPTEGRA